MKRLMRGSALDAVDLAHEARVLRGLSHKYITKYIGVGASQSTRGADMGLNDFARARARVRERERESEKGRQRRKDEGRNGSGIRSLSLSTALRSSATLIPLPLLLKKKKNFQKKLKNPRWPPD